MTKRASMLMGVLLAGLAFAAAPAQAEYLVNGGFETGDFTGWTLSGNTGFLGVQCPGPGPSVFEGNCSAFGGPVGSLGFINQTITGINAGSSVTISLAWLADGGTPSEFDVEWNGVHLLDSINHAASGFLTPHFLVQATGGPQVLTISMRDDPGFLLLDAVSVVPEPATMALLGLGLAGLGFARRRRAA